MIRFRIVCYSSLCQFTRPIMWLCLRLWQELFLVYTVAGVNFRKQYLEIHRWQNIPIDYFFDQIWFLKHRLVSIVDLQIVCDRYNLCIFDVDRRYRSTGWPTCIIIWGRCFVFSQIVFSHGKRESILKIHAFYVETFQQRPQLMKSHSVKNETWFDNMRFKRVFIRTDSTTINLEYVPGSFYNHNSLNMIILLKNQVSESFHIQQTHAYTRSMISTGDWITSKLNSLI